MSLNRPRRICVARLCYHEHIDASYHNQKVADEEAVEEEEVCGRLRLRPNNNNRVNEFVRTLIESSWEPSMFSKLRRRSGFRVV